MKHKIIKNIRTLFKEEHDYYKPIRVGDFLNNNYVEYKSNGDRSIKLSVKEYLDKFKPYLRDIINCLQNSETWNIQLTIAINFISSKDVEEKRVMNSKSNNTEFMPCDDANEVVDGLFQSLLSRYQNNLETSIRGCDFNFYPVHPVTE